MPALLYDVSTGLVGDADYTPNVTPTPTPAPSPTPSPAPTPTPVDSTVEGLTLGENAVLTPIGNSIYREYTVSGIDAGVNLPVSVDNAEYRINSGSYITEPSTVTLGDVIGVFITVSDTNLKTVTLNVGSQSTSITVTGLAVVTPTPVPAENIHYADRVINVFGGEGVVHKGTTAPRVYPDIHPDDEVWVWFSFQNYEVNIDSVEFELPDGWVNLGNLSNKNVEGRNGHLLTKCYGVKFRSNNTLDGEHLVTIKVNISAPHTSTEHFSGKVGINTRK